MRRYPAPAGRVRHRGDRPGRSRGTRAAGLAALPSGESAAAHERDAGEALLGRVLSRMAVRRRRRRWALATAAVVLAAAAAAGWALRPGSPPSGPVASGTVLQTETIGRVTVLADAAGFTLHWFASDTAAGSNCTGSCARRWPPVTGPATAGAGVTGAVGWVTPTDGSIQATYDGHFLYGQRGHRSRPGQGERPGRIRRAMARSHGLGRCGARLQPVPWHALWRQWGKAATVIKNVIHRWTAPAGRRSRRARPRSG